MSKSRAFVVVLSGMLVAIALISGCGSSTKSTSSTPSGGEVTGNVTGESIQANAGEQFQVTLESNPTTGYEWKITTRPDAKVVTEKGSTFIAPSSSSVMGAPGTEVWTFQAVAAGNTNIVFENKQVSAGPKTTPAQTHNVSVKVVAAPTTPPAAPKTYTNPSTPISETMGNEFLINMSEQTASTGYTWLLSTGYDHKVCVFKGVTWATSTNAVPGSPQIEVWRFAAVGKGSTKLTFNYVQPWDKSAKPAKSVTFTVNVN
jgi:inhibitor of cysteine peptidase